jgi:hypothetical protein
MDRDRQRQRQKEIEAERDRETDRETADRYRDSETKTERQRDRDSDAETVRDGQSVKEKKYNPFLAFQCRKESDWLCDCLLSLAQPRSEQRR